MLNSSNFTFEDFFRVFKLWLEHEEGKESNNYRKKQNDDSDWSNQRNPVEAQFHADTAEPNSKYRIITHEDEAPHKKQNKKDINLPASKHHSKVSFKPI